MISGKRISGLMLDLSGTVHVDDKLLPGVQEAISLVRGRKIPIQFVTNTSKENLDSLASKLRHAGLSVENEDIFTSLTAAKQLGKSPVINNIMTNNFFLPTFSIFSGE